MNALCVVGEWRTFAMPAVYTSIVQASKVWRADAFMFYHTRYDAEAMSHPHRNNASACEFKPSLLKLFMYTKEVAPPCTEKNFKASIQFFQISACFKHVMQTAQKINKRYDWFVRSRPDYLIYDPKPLPSITDKILAGYPKPDMLFAIPRKLISMWFHGMSSECISACCIEYSHRIFTAKAYSIWNQDGSIVRGINRTTFETNKTKIVHGLNCNITSFPTRKTVRSSKLSAFTRSRTSKGQNEK